MSNYSNTKATIAANVYTNHNHEVTAAMVKTGINTVVDALIAGGYLWAGVAHPGDAASTPDANVVKVATEVGTYTNYKNSSNVALTVADGEVAVFTYNGSWTKEVTGAATAAEVTALGHKVSEKVPIKYGKNLLDPDFCTAGKFVGTNGTINDNVNYYLSDYIPIVAGENYYASDNQDRCLGSAAAIFAWYGESRNFLGYTSGEDMAITAPASAKYLRVSIRSARFSLNPQVELGSSRTAFVQSTPIAGYPIVTLPSAIVGTPQLADGSVTEPKLATDVKNKIYLNGNDITPTRVLSSFRLRLDGDAFNVSDTTDVAIFLLGPNQKFKVKGKCSITTPICGLIPAAYDNFSPFLKIADSNGGDYELYGETTDTLQYVAITVDKSTAYSCQASYPVSEFVKSLNNRKRVDIKTTDSEIDILNKMLAAYTTGDCDVYFEHGEYIFQDVYLYMRDTLHWTWTMELPIGNGCRYFFNNSTLISEEPTEEYEESRNILGCKAGQSNKFDYELYDGILINNGGTYCVHDEATYGTAPYIHKYHNMKMVLNESAGMGYISKCIGGGAGVCGLVIIDNCVFEQHNPTLSTEDVSWHGLDDANTPSDMRFFVTQCYFSRKFRVAGTFKATDSLFVKYSGNSAADAPSITSDPSTLEVVLFNNETRP